MKLPLHRELISSITMLQKIVSGGQTGADRTALDVAQRHGYDTGGWCPAGRIAEDGPIDERYLLKETPSDGYSQRTEWNVRDSDGTLILSSGPELTSGSALTRKFAKKWSRPCLWVSETVTKNPVDEVLIFLDDHRIEVLNVAGPRDTTEAGISRFVTEILGSALARLNA